MTRLKSSLLHLKIWRYRVVHIIFLSVPLVYVCLYITGLKRTLVNRELLETLHRSLPDKPTSKILSAVKTKQHLTLKYEPKFLLNPVKICLDKSLHLLVYVHSAVGYLHKRLVIRNTWGSITNLKNYNAKIVFITGLPKDSVISDSLKLESERFGDIVLADFQDSYKNLTMKAKSAFTWISKYCGNVTYVLKTDDDTFIHTERLHKYITSQQIDSKPKTDFLACNYKDMTLTPFRKKTSKYYVSYEDYPASKYPRFCQGMAYLMSCDVVHKLNAALRNPVMNKPFVWLDDVYMTGVVFGHLKLNHTGISYAYRMRADAYLLKKHKYLIFFQSNEITTLWKIVKTMVS